MFLVKDFWDQGRNNGKWRNCKDLGYSDESSLKAKADALTQDLEHRRVLVSSSPDQFIWGKNIEGFIGPYKCYLCGSHEETIEHLLNLCPFTSKVWDWVASIFRQCDRDSLNISNTLKNWRKNFSGNDIINKAWILVPSFVIWNVWKERNSQILKNKTSKPQYIIDQILRQLKGTMRNLLRTLPKDPPLPQEESIILHLDLQFISPQGIIKGVSQINTGVNTWKPPPYCFLKVNIDGASKGNPGLAGFGGAIRDDQGKIKKIFHGHLGKATNNMAELMALEKCLEILVDSNSHNVIIEAD
eukprot:PITA_23753